MKRCEMKEIVEDVIKHSEPEEIAKRPILPDGSKALTIAGRDIDFAWLAREYLKTGPISERAKADIDHLREHRRELLRGGHRSCGVNNLDSLEDRAPDAFRLGVALHEIAEEAARLAANKTPTQRRQEESRRRRCARENAAIARAVADICAA